MQNRLLPLAARTLLGLTIAALASAAPRAHAQQTEVTVLYNFPENTEPIDILLGSDGNFYGVGPNDLGIGTYDAAVFKLTPDGQETMLCTFPKTSTGTQVVSRLVQARDGNLYGVTTAGGANGLGTVFQVTPAGTLTTLHTFGAAEGNQPQSGLIQGSDGNLYGTTNQGGTYGVGTVFKCTTTGTLTTLHTFNGSNDGGLPAGALVEVGSGIFYGATNSGGDHAGYGAGTVFQVTAAGDFQILHVFRTSDSMSPLRPVSQLVVGSDGNLYGTTLSGPGQSQGCVYRVTPAGVVTTLHNFTDPNDGENLQPGVVFGSDGNLYGTTFFSAAGGSNLYRVTPGGDFAVLHTFAGGDTGYTAEGMLVPTSDGAFYGTTLDGGTADGGTLFKVTFHPAFFAGEVELDDQVYYLSFAASGNPFGYYSYLADPHYIYHFDLGYEYLFDAGDGQGGLYLYDFKSGGFFYSSPSFPFPYLYDFSLNTVLYYYPDPDNPGHYNTDGVRYFYDYGTGEIILK